MPDTIHKFFFSVFIFTFFILWVAADNGLAVMPEIIINLLPILDKNRYMSSKVANNHKILVTPSQFACHKKIEQLSFELFKKYTKFKKFIFLYTAFAKVNSILTNFNLRFLIFWLIKKLCLPVPDQIYRLRVQDFAIAYLHKLLWKTKTKI